EDPLHRGRAAEQRRELVAVLDRAAQRRDVADERLPLERPLHDHLDLVDLEWLGQVVVGAALERRDRRLRRREGGHDHDLRRGAALLDLVEEREAVNGAGHLEVRDDEVHGLGGERAQRDLRVLGGRDLVPGAREADRQELAQRALVVDDQDRSHRQRVYLFCATTIMNLPSRRRSGASAAPRSRRASSACTGPKRWRSAVSVTTRTPRTVTTAQSGGR